jgi:dihydroflavonol-4-reductase
VAGLFARPLLPAGHDLGAHELAARACALAGRRPPALRASARAAATAAVWTEWVLGTMGLETPSPSLPALLLCEARATGVGEAQRALGVLPRPLEETLRDAMEWYRALGYMDESSPSAR